MLQVSSLFSKSRNVCLLSFITVSLIFFFVVMAGEVYPFGDQCILRTDMYHQYAPFFSELRDKLRSGESLSFTWNLGLGVNFTAIIVYYLASPLNLLVAFVSEDHVIEFMTVLIIVKAGLAGASMAYYLKANAPENGAGAYLFSLFYGLSGYICAYYWNLMWLDAVLMFPITVLGAERLIKGRSGILYGAALGFSIFSNYYISILICIFLVFYFFLYSLAVLGTDIRQFFKAGIRFTAWSLLAAGLASVMLLPEIYAFTLTASSSNEFPKVYTDYFSLLSELARHLPMVETEQGLDHWPNIYCGTGVLFLIVLYVSNRRIPLREKAAYIAVAFFMLAGFAINVLNFIWHGMHYPNSLPARQSFIYIFLILFMCFRAWENIGCMTKREIVRAFAVSMILILFWQDTAEDDAFPFGSFYMALVLTAAYALFMHMFRSGRTRRRLIGAAVFMTALIELSANTAYTSITTTSRKAYTDDNADVRILTAEAEGLSDGFYRMERSQRKSKDDGAWLNFPSASLFSSMANADCSDFFRRLGCEASTNAYSITGSTPLVDMLLGINYELNTDAYQETGISRIISASGHTNLYENTYALSPGFVMPQKMASEWMIDSDDPALVQNSLCDALKTEQILIPVYNGGSSVDGECAVTISETGLYYAYEENFDAGDITVSRPAKKKTYTNLDRSYFMELGKCERGELITFTAENKGYDPGIIIYRLNENALKSIYEALSPGELKISAFGDDYIRGSVTVDTDALGYSYDRASMLMTIPYDEGWRVYVDGEETEIYKGLGTFISFYVSGGVHDIELKYFPKGLKAGAAISLISLMILAGAAALQYGPGRRRKTETLDDALADGDDHALTDGDNQGLKMDN